MRNFSFSSQQESDEIAILTEFIHSNPEAKKLKRALAIKMTLQGTSSYIITKMLKVSHSFIERWTRKFKLEGLDGINPVYQRHSSYLTPEQRRETIIWLRAKEFCHFNDLVTYLEQKHNVTYKSKKSYYDLFSFAKINCKNRN